MQKLIEGKTKIVWSTEQTSEVLIESKNDITAGDGAKRDFIEGKAELATTTTVNVFELLKCHDIPTHFIEKVGATTFLAMAVTMIPIEIVTRRIAFGSYLKRNPAVKPESILPELVVELFDKDDALHDPLLQLNLATGSVERHTASLPVGEGIIDELSAAEAAHLRVSDWDALRTLARGTFEVIEKAWSAQSVTLVDMKIECGVTADGDIVVADVIDNDSWRIWPGGESDRMVDKQLYRNGESLHKVEGAYVWVAQATGKF